MKTLSKAIAIASLVSASALTAQVAQAEVEVSASVAASNMYLWRGIDLGSVVATDDAGDDTAIPGGAAAISGDLSISMGGAYAGVWTSSGDVDDGQEYDLYAGYALEAGGVSIDASVWSYVYPSQSDSDSMFDLTEVVVSLGYAGASVTVYDNVAGDSDYQYVALGYGMGDVSATVGQQITDGDDYTHLDISYAYSENLSFTASKVVAQDTNSAVEEDMHVQVVLSLPIK